MYQDILHKYGSIPLKNIVIPLVINVRAHAMYLIGKFDLKQITCLLLTLANIVTITKESIIGKRKTCSNVTCQQVKLIHKWSRSDWSDFC